jgi:hypothetical protein
MLQFESITIDTVYWMLKYDMIILSVLYSSHSIVFVVRIYEIHKKGRKARAGDTEQQQKLLCLFRNLRLCVFPSFSPSISKEQLLLDLLFNSRAVVDSFIHTKEY